MRIISKKLAIIFGILLIPYLIILYTCIVRTDQEAILTGGLTDVSSFVDIESDKEEKGSFNSIYVTTYYPTTIFQKLILDTSTVNTSVDNSAVTHLSNKELNAMGSISHNASVMYSLMTAYNAAKEIDSSVNLDYSYAGIRIYFYKEGLELKVNDLITKINGISFTEETSYKDAFSNQKTGDIFTINRDGNEIDITLTNDYFPREGYVNYQFYSMYDINYENSSPRINVSSSGTGGPSGGLLQTLSVFNQITDYDYSLGLKVAGTGTMSLNTSVGVIGGITQKIYTAYENKVDIFFCPRGNYEEALIAWNKLKHKERMELVVVDTFSDAISYLETHEKI